MAFGKQIQRNVGTVLNPFRNKGRDTFSATFDPGDFLGIQKKRAQREVNRIKKKRDRLKLAKASAEQMRKAIIARAQVAQAAANQGVGSSSAAEGAQGSILTQAAANIGFANQIFSMNMEAGKRLEDLNDEIAHTAIAKQVTSFFAGGAGGLFANMNSKQGSNTTGSFSNQNLFGSSTGLTSNTSTNMGISDSVFGSEQSTGFYNLGNKG